MNPHYVSAVKAVKMLNTKGNTLFASLMAFTIGEAYLNGLPPHGTNIKPLFLQHERAATVELKVEMSKNSTYRVVKNLLINCVGKGISLLDSSGKHKGKTELEAELADTKTPLSDIEKFKQAMTAATNLNAKLNDGERLTCAKLVQELLSDMTKQLKMVA